MFAGRIALPNFWIRFQNGRWWWREPLKGALLGLTVFGVCFPYPWLFVRNVQRWRDLGALIEPQAEELVPLLDELRPKLDGIESGPDALKVVEKFVYEKIPYAWDWETWGVVDYIPRVEEVLAAGQEDCDGRAVVAASLLRNLGYQAELVTDITHVWVKTDRGETMSPGRMKKFIETSDGGLRINWRALTNIPSSMAYGVGVFPLGRELIVLAVLWLLYLCPGVPWPVLGVALLLMLDGLVILRSSGADPWHQNVVTQWFGFANLVLGVVVLDAGNRRARRKARVTAVA